MKTPQEWTLYVEQDDHTKIYGEEIGPWSECVEVQVIEKAAYESIKNLEPEIVALRSLVKKARTEMHKLIFENKRLELIGENGASMAVKDARKKNAELAIRIGQLEKERNKLKKELEIARRT